MYSAPIPHPQLQPDSLRSARQMGRPPAPGPRPDWTGESPVETQTLGPRGLSVLDGAIPVSSPSQSPLQLLVLACRSVSWQGPVITQERAAVPASQALQDRSVKFRPSITSTRSARVITSTFRTGVSSALSYRYTSTQSQPRTPVQLGSRPPPRVTSSFATRLDTHKRNLHHHHNSDSMHFAPPDSARKVSPMNGFSASPATSVNGGSASPSTSSEHSYKATSPVVGAGSATSVRDILSSLSVSTSQNSPQKKRRRDETLSPLKLLQQAKAGTTRTGPPLTATHEIRFLRKEVAEMEHHLQQLESKWVETIPDERIIRSACQAAKEKWTTTQVEQVNAELREQLTQQQFIFASLQSAILQSPLQSQCREMYEAIHLGTKLSTNAAERIEQLQAHSERGISVVPDIVNRFTGHIASSPTPYSQTNITGGADHTYISNVFVLELPHTSLHEVFQATLGYYALLANEMLRCVATKMEVQPLNILGKLRQYAKVKFTNNLFTTTVNTTFAAKIVDGVAVIHSDGIVSDPLHPIPADEPVSRIGVNAITITPVTDSVTGKITKVVLRRVLIYRFNLLPHDPLVQKDMKLNQCVINGDLFTAMVCQNLQQQRPDLIEMVAAGTYQEPTLE